MTPAPAPGPAEAPFAAARRRTGERLVRERGCRNCHRIPNLAGQRGDQGHRRGVFDHRPHPWERPPDLAGLGKKLAPAWLRDFLLRPVALRPWLRPLQMPAQPDPALAEALAAAFAARDSASYPFRPPAPAPLPPAERAQARALFERLKCLSCHQLSGQQQLKPGELAPDLALARDRLRRAWLRRFILEPQQVMPGTKMPTLFPLLDEEDPAGGRLSAAPDLFGGEVARQVEALVAVTMEQLWR